MSARSSPQVKALEAQLEMALARIAKLEAK